jgi:hypothetical protein
MEAANWLMAIEKKMLIAQCSYHEKVLFTAHQLFGTTVDWWETYCNAHDDVESIMWNEFKASFRSHYVPHGTIKLRK